MLEPKFPYFIGDIPENIPMSDDQKSDEESVRSVYTTEEDTGYVTPETHRQISQDTPDTQSNTQNGPRIGQMLSNIIEVDINEEDPESAEAEAAHEIFKCIGDEYIYAITDTESLDDEGVDKHEVSQEEEKELISQKT